MNLKELSEHLSLSQTTVSRALAGYDDVSPKTRERVCRAAETYDYRPNSRAQSLARGRSKLIGLILHAPDDIAVCLSETGLPARLCRYLKRCGYGSFFVLPDPNGGTYGSQLIEPGGVDGAIVVSVTECSRIKTDLEALGIPNVLLRLDACDTNGSASRISTDVIKRLLRRVGDIERSQTT